MKPSQKRAKDWKILATRFEDSEFDMGKTLTEFGTHTSNENTTNIAPSDKKKKQDFKVLSTGSDIHFKSTYIVQIMICWNKLVLYHATCLRVRSWPRSVE